MGAVIMGAAMLDENCIVQCPIWYRQSVAKNVYTGESGAALVTVKRPLNERTAMT